MTTDFVQKFESKPDKKRQKKKHDEFSQNDKAIDIRRKSANLLCFVIKISGKYVRTVCGQRENTVQQIRLEQGHDLLTSRSCALVIILVFLLPVGFGHVHIVGS